MKSLNLEKIILLFNMLKGPYFQTLGGDTIFTWDLLNSHSLELLINVYFF